MPYLSFDSRLVCLSAARPNQRHVVCRHVDALRQLEAGASGELASDPASPAVVLVTHHVEEIPAGFGHIVMMARGSVIAAGALVTEGARIPPGSLVVGVPGRVVRPVDDELRARIRLTVDHYRALKDLHSGGRWQPRA